LQLCNHFFISKFEKLKYLHRIQENLKIKKKQKTMKKYFIMTFGCQMNYADSEKVNMLLLQSGFMTTKDWRDADLIIFNTCSVRKK
jgi:tRNA-2-methylthio-N6-dimethylallyladenosine synthase